MPVIMRFLFSLLLCLVALGCTRQSPLLSPTPVDLNNLMDVQTSGPVVPLTASRWTEGLSPTYVRFKNDAAGNLYVDWPSGNPNKTWNYAFGASTTKVLTGKTLTATVTQTVLSGLPAFIQAPEAGNTCPVAPNMRPFLFAYRNDWSGEFSRWWASQGWTLVAPGTYQWSVPFQPDLWTSVYGKSGAQAPAQFADALKNISSVGFTFGGGCFYGHGVYVAGGTARWTLSQLLIQ